MRHDAWVPGCPLLISALTALSAETPARRMRPAPTVSPEIQDDRRVTFRLWIGCGKDDFLIRRNEAFIDRLREPGIRHEWHRTDGTRSGPVWRRYVADIAPRLFQ